MAEASVDLKAVPAKSAGKKSVKKEEPKDTIWSRRDFFSLAGWAGFAATLGFSTLFFTRLLFPRVLFEPSPIFKAAALATILWVTLAQSMSKIRECGLYET